MKYLWLLVLLLAIPCGETNTCCAFTIAPYQPVVLKQIDTRSPNDNSASVTCGPAFVQSSLTVSKIDSRSCDELKYYIEKLTHAYYDPKSVNSLRLQSLRSKFGNFLKHSLPAELGRELSEYESLCECVSNKIRSGLTLPEIYARKLCGSDTTKGRRMRIIEKCKACPKAFSKK